MYPQRTAREISDQIANSGILHIRLLGTSTRHWALQKNLLRHHSPYFRALLSPNGLDETVSDLEALQGNSPLLTAEPFELLVQWLYTGSIDPARPTPADLDIYIRLYCLCSPAHLDMPALQALALARMRDLHRNFAIGFSADHVRYIYAHTAPASPLRRIVVQAAACDFMRDASAKPTNTGLPASYAHMTASADFATELLYTIRDHVGPQTLPHPFFLVDQDDDKPDHAPPTSPRVVPCPASPDDLPSPSLLPATPPPSSPCLAPLTPSHPISTSVFSSPCTPAAAAAAVIEVKEQPGLTVSVTGVWTPEVTPKKSIREGVRRRSQGEWMKEMLSKAGKEAGDDVCTVDELRTVEEEL